MIVVLDPLNGEVVLPAAAVDLRQRFCRIAAVDGVGPQGRTEPHHGHGGIQPVAASTASASTPGNAAASSTGPNPMAP